MKKVFIIHNFDKPVAKELFKESVKYFNSKGVEIVENEENAEFGVVIGGDGTLLTSFSRFLEKNLFVIAISAGTLGFLTEIKKEKMLEEYENFLNGNFKFEKRHVLEIYVGEEKFYALNELCVLKAGTISRILKLNCEANGEYVCTYKGDGVIIATPTGSTAYSMSAGGPIMKPDMKAFIITPLAPHNLNTRPIVISGDDEITLKISDTDRIGEIIVDGQICKELSNMEKIRINYSNYTLNLVIPSGRNYYSVLREKLKWGDNLC